MENLGYYEMMEGSRPVKVLTENVQFSENMQYHLGNNLSLSNTVFRMGSEAWMDLVNEARSLWEKGLIEVNENDEYILMTEAGRTGVYQGKSVALDAPRRAPAGEKKKFLEGLEGFRKSCNRVVLEKFFYRILT